MPHHTTTAHSRLCIHLLHGTPTPRQNVHPRVHPTIVHLLPLPLLRRRLHRPHVQLLRLRELLLKPLVAELERVFA